MDGAKIAISSPAQTGIQAERDAFAIDLAGAEAEAEAGASARPLPASPALTVDAFLAARAARPSSRRRHANLAARGGIFFSLVLFVDV